MTGEEKGSQGRTAKHSDGVQRGFSVERFARSFTRRPRPMHILMLVLFLILGIAITTTVRSRVSDPLAGLNEDQLVAILGDLDQREQTLLAERGQLQIQLSELEQAADAQQAARDAVNTATQQAEVAAGTVPVRGPGVVARVSGDVSRVPVSVFVTTLAELRNAGAEAISINDTRLNGRAWFGTNGDGAIVASGTVLEPPYIWRALGDGNTLSLALEIRGGAASQFRAYGAGVDIRTEDDLHIDAVAPPFDPQWAQPATS